MKLLSFLDIINIYAGMNRTTAVEKLDVLVGTLLCNIVAEVAVGDKENLSADWAFETLTNSRRASVSLS